MGRLGDLAMKEDSVADMLLSVCLLHPQKQRRIREWNRDPFNLGNFDGLACLGVITSSLGIRRGLVNSFSIR
jgi:hypothetical protein